jgi:hypothetical protein
MEVYVVPVGPDRYELYCEPGAEPETGEGEPAVGFIGRLRRRFSEMVRAAEDEEHEARPEPRGWLARLQRRSLGWVAQRIAEQRLLWNLRRHAAATAVHPAHLTAGQVESLVRGTLRRDFERHRRWLVIDAFALAVTGPLLFFVPGPNMVAYFFTFRVFGHYLSMRGALQGLQRVRWSHRPSPALDRLRDLAALDPAARDARVREIEAALHLQHLARFVARVGARHAW